jgi:hypothetical protein
MVLLVVRARNCVGGVAARAMPPFERIRRGLEREAATGLSHRSTRARNTADQEFLAPDQQSVIDEVRYMTDYQREIIAYFRAHPPQLDEVAPVVLADSGRAIRGRLRNLNKP